MPTYEYLCQTCSHRFETWQKMTDEPLTVCPECGAHIRRVLFPAGVVFKGSGFYKNDYSKGKGAPAATTGENAKSEGSTENKATNDGKPAESKSTESSNGNTASKSESKPANTTPANT